MSRLPDDISGHDVNQWLRRTWFKVVEEEQPVLFSINEGQRVYYQRADGSEGRTDTRNIRLWWPRTGAINVPGLGALYVQRTAVRQWRRSYSSRELTCHVPQERMARLMSPMLPSLNAQSPSVVMALHDPVYHTVGEALDMLETVPGVAISRSVILAKVSHSETAVYFNNKLVGVIEPDGTYVPEGDARLVARAQRALRRAA